MTDLLSFAFATQQQLVAVRGGGRHHPSPPIRSVGRPVVILSIDIMPTLTGKMVPFGNVHHLPKTKGRDESTMINSLTE